MGDVGDSWRDDWPGEDGDPAARLGEVEWTPRRPVCQLYAPSGEVLAVKWDRPPTGFTRSTLSD